MYIKSSHTYQTVTGIPHIWEQFLTQSRHQLEGSSLCSVFSVLLGLKPTEGGHHDYPFLKQNFKQNMLLYSQVLQSNVWQLREQGLKIIYRNFLNTQLSLWSWALQERPPLVQPLRRFLAFYGIQIFIIAFTKSTSPVPILSQTNPVQTTPRYLYKIHLTVIHSPTSWCSQWSPSFWLSYQ
jgi:hypothetical protein